MKFYPVIVVYSLRITRVAMLPPKYHVGARIVLNPQRVNWPSGLAYPAPLPADVLRLGTSRGPKRWPSRDDAVGNRSAPASGAAGRALATRTGARNQLVCSGPVSSARGRTEQQPGRLRSPAIGPNGLGANPASGGSQTRTSTTRPETPRRADKMPRPNWPSKSACPASRQT